MANTPWDRFFEEKMKIMLSQPITVIDIGGGLRISKQKNNRYDPSREWLRPLIERVDYKVLDPVPDYNPDIVGDIHALPLDDNSIDAIICMAVLEHVKNPFLAMQEMYRVLKPGGQLYLYVPFLYYYHPMKPYYDDYWRFTKDGLDELGKTFTTHEIQSVRGALETWVYLSPLGRIKFCNWIANWLDRKSGKIRSNQTSGFNMYAIK